MNKHVRALGLGVIALPLLALPAFASADATILTGASNAAGVAASISGAAGSYVSAGETLLTVAAAILAWRVGSKLVHKTT